MQIKSIELSGETYLSTLSMYKAIGLFSHQKLKDRIVRHDLAIQNVADFGTALTLADSLIILKAYQANSGGERLTQVNALLKECAELTNMGKSEILKTNTLTQKERVTHPLSPKLQNMGKENIENPKQKTDPLKSVKPRKLTQQKSKAKALKKSNSFLYYLTELTILLRTEQFIFLILFFAIGIQINHTAHLYHRTGAYLNPAVGWIDAYIFGTVTELTALLLTIHDGKKNKLLIFALLTFWVNLLYYEVWKSIATISPEVMHFISKITLSGIIAFVLYAYTDLFTEWVNKKT